MDRPRAPSFEGREPGPLAPLSILLVNRHREDVLGGSELQCDRIATELAARGHAVAYAVRVPRRARYERPYRCEPAADLAAVARLLESARAEVVYWRFNRHGLREGVALAHARGARFVYALSHDDDTRRVPRTADLWPPRRALRALQSAWNAGAVARVDGFVAQHAGQARGLPPQRTRVIHNSAVVEHEPFAWPRPYVAWVANLKARKRPERFVELARALADTGRDFLAVGALQDPRYAWLGERARVPTNFHWLGELAPRAANGVIAGAEALALTCEPEGFPNVLLQAWTLGVPSVSLAYDPEELIARHALGAVAATPAELARALRALLADRDARSAMGTRAQALIAREFTLAANVDALEAFLRALVSPGGARSGAP
jgi:glycosyltransferase involved in cell wall biosynthesis